MPPIRLSDLPRDARLWVQATILSSAIGSVAACGSPQHTDSVPPTCGPCCHGGGPECDQQQVMEAVSTGDEPLASPDTGPPDTGPPDTGPPDAGPSETEQVAERPPDYIRNMAPTCGPSCHSGGGPGGDLGQPER